MGRCGGGEASGLQLLVTSALGFAYDFNVGPEVVEGCRDFLLASGEMFVQEVLAAGKAFVKVQLHNLLGKAALDVFAYEVAGSGRAPEACVLRQQPQAPAVWLRQCGSGIVRAPVVESPVRVAKAAVASRGSDWSEGIVLSLFNAHGRCAELTMSKFQFTFWFGSVWNSV